MKLWNKKGKELKCSTAGSGCVLGHHWASLQGLVRSFVIPRLMPRDNEHGDHGCWCWDWCKIHPATTIETDWCTRLVAQIRPYIWIPFENGHVQPTAWFVCANNSRRNVGVECTFLLLNLRDGDVNWKMSQKKSPLTFRWEVNGWNIPFNNDIWHKYQHFTQAAFQLPVELCKT